MNDVNYILTADDFGPIKFVNEGILHHVRLGSINSVQVLTNFDSNELYANLVQLNDAAKHFGPIDLGVHLTLTSGKPLYQGEDGETAQEVWGDFLEEDKHGGGLQFKSFKNFHFSFFRDQHAERYRRAIKEEFKLQINALQDALNQLAVNHQVHLQLTSISNHHNIMTTGIELFECYLNAAEGANLAIRSPKIVPHWKGWSFYKLILSKKYRDGNKENVAEIKKLFDDFSNNRYSGERSLTLQSPSYIDIRLYASLGSVLKSPVPIATGIPSRIRKFTDFKNFARRKYAPVAEDPIDPIKVETVFHLGYGEMPSEDELKSTYDGVTIKYFDNRITETHALEKMKKEGKNDVVFDQLVSWKTCGKVTFK